MCDVPVPPPSPLSRRGFLVAAPLGALGAAALGRTSAAPVTVAQGVSIVPRAEWGGSLAPTGPVPDEPDVRFLLVHHSVNANTYAQGAVSGLLTGIYRFHTGDKGWPDIAYNFFVDRFGGVWEGRTGSLAGAKAVDATGGSQGFAQLCCFLGDHSSEPPSAAAQQSMGALLGWLAQRHGVDLGDGARARFTSRGSNRFPAGAAVDVATVAGHRDVSQTACPGDAAYALVQDGTFRRLARGGGTVSAPPRTAAPATSGPTSTTGATTVPAPSTSAASTTTLPPSTSSSATSTTGRGAGADLAVGGGDDGGGTSSWVQAGIGAGALAAVTGGLVALRARRSHRPQG